MYFNALENILGNRPATEPMVVIDSLSGKPEVDVESNVSEIDKEEHEAELWESNMKESDARESSSTDNQDSGSNKDVVVVKKEDKVNVKPIVSNKKKRKRQLVEVMHERTN